MGSKGIVTNLLRSQWRFTGQKQPSSSGDRIQQTIGGTPQTPSGRVCVDHRDAHVGMTHELPHRTDLGSRLRQMRGEAVTPPLRGDTLVKVGGHDSFLVFTLQSLLKEMVLADF